MKRILINSRVCFICTEFCYIDRHKSMATASSITTELTTCPICQDLFTDPKALPCMHAFCLICLKIYFRSKLPGDTASCPVCRRKFQIPLNGVDGLPHHFIIQQVLELNNLLESPCDVHREKHVELYCRDCNENTVSYTHLTLPTIYSV